MDQPKPNYPVIPLQVAREGDHYCFCPICGHWVDVLDLEEVFQHWDEDHKAPTKN